MEQFEIKTEIVCRWWEVGGEKVLKRHTEKLRKIGSSHIRENIQKGFTSGELPTQRYSTHNKMYTGWWELKLIS